MDTSLDTIKELLKREIGLDASTVGEATIRKFLGQRMRARKLDNIENYCSLLESDSNELSALLETAVIPETWFFRDTRPFTIILKTLQNNSLKYFNRPCNILCIPCSTGEEPYSAAIFLLEAGIPASSFRIKAVDISQRALDIAMQGSYGNNSFRGRTSKQYIDKHFSFNDGQYLINDAIRECISFHRVNILDATTLPYEKNFDFILCRNLLIYFDVSTKIKAFKNLHRILKDDGLLFIGHSEFGAVPGDLFANTGSGNAFGLKKYTADAESGKTLAPAHNTRPVAAAIHSATTGKNTAPLNKPAFANFNQAPVQPAPDKTPATTNNKTSRLEQAQKLADDGKLEEAEECCMHHIEENGDDCESFFLLALINESAGKQNMAETLFRKAIYLEPKHYQSLIHLALLLEGRGDHKAASLLRQRAERALKN